jgi:hypothetical protein
MGHIAPRVLYRMHRPQAVNRNDARVVMLIPQRRRGFGHGGQG